MKKIFTLFALLALTTALLAQVPQKFTYQAIVRDASGKLIANSQIGARISILKNNAEGTSVYAENHQQTTNANGLLTLVIGNGATESGSFTSIDWGNDIYFIKTEIDVNGGTNYTIVTSQQLLSVPYALYAENAANQFSGDYNDLTNKPVIPTTTEELTNNSGFITNGNIPSKVSAFENDAQYITHADIPTKVSAFENDAKYITNTDVPAETDPTVAAWAKQANKPAYDYNEIQNTPSLAKVATSGDYKDLKNQPELFDGDYNSLTNQPAIPSVPAKVSAFENDAKYITNADIPTKVSALENDANYITNTDVPAETDPTVAAWAKQANKPAYDYNEIQNTPSLAKVATSGDYKDLKNQPELFNGDYNSLTNQPAIPSVPTKVSAFENDANYITGADIPTKVSAFENDAKYITNADIPTKVSALENDANYLTSFTEQQILSISNDTIFLTGGSFVKLPIQPTKLSQLINDMEFLTDANVQEAANIPTKVSAFENDANYITSADIPAETDPTVAAWAKEANKPAYDYNEIKNTPAIPSVPTKVSAFENDANYLTSDSLQALRQAVNELTALVNDLNVKMEQELFIATANQTNFTLQHTPKPTCIIRCYINGVMVGSSKSGLIEINDSNPLQVIYKSASNRNYTIKAGDKVTIVYWY